MLYAYIAIYLETFAFLLPPFRQKGGKYFPFFVATALGNPISITIVELFHIDPKYILCFIAWFMFLSLMKKEFLKKNVVYLIIITSLMAGNEFYLKPDEVQIFTIFIDFFIFLYFLKEAVIYYKFNFSINTGHIILILYALGLVTKLYIVVSNIKSGLFYFYSTDFFEIFIAIFFTIYKVEDAPKINLLRSVD